MVRRPRPVHRTAQVSKQARPRATDFLSDSESAAPARATLTTRLQETDNDEHEDVDAPRVAQWIDDEELEQQERLDDTSASLDSEGVDDGDHSASEARPSQKLRSLEDDLSTLPLGTLRSAQRSLAQAHALSDTESESEASGDDFSAADVLPHPAKGKAKADERPKPKISPAKRTNKHAPIEVTSKRPVSRQRVVVDDKVPRPRDPRFMYAAGRFDPSKFKQQYGFLSGLHKDELLTLREHTKRAHKLLANSPSHLMAEREEEVKRLERAMKSAESAVNLDNRERVELEALQSAKQTEKEKRKQGKAEWWMKRSEKKQLLAKARLDAIASVGGKQAVKKAIQKKQKKMGQKEKKSRPFPRSQGIKGPNDNKRRPGEPVGSETGGKRRKVN